MIINGNHPDHKANGVALIWENSNPSEIFDANQTIELDMDKYTSIFVEMVFSNDIQDILGVINIHKDAWTVVEDEGSEDGEEEEGNGSQSSDLTDYPYSTQIKIPFAGSTSNGSVNIAVIGVASRAVHVSSNGVVFDSGFFNDTLTNINSSDNKYAIPYCIYGSHYV